MQTFQADPVLGPLVRLLWTGDPVGDRGLGAGRSVALVQCSARYYTALQDPTVLITA